MEQINGDHPGSILNRLMYFFQCIKNHNKGSNENCETINPTLSIVNLDSFNKSPSRLLCDGFWNSINYQKIKLYLNSNLKFLDIGCGSGKYGKLYRKLSNKCFESYTGLDIYEDDKYPAEFDHICDKAENVYQHINNRINFVVSQSALEHIEKDKLVIEEITKKLCENNSPFIQIHLVPASRCLWLYLWHGYRQYSKKNLSNISNQLKKKFNINTCIVPLGGNISFWSHLRHITLPVYLNRLLLNYEFKWYDKDIEKKIIKSVNRELDCNKKNPIFWAFIINSDNINFKDIFSKN